MSRIFARRRPLRALALSLISLLAALATVPAGATHDPEVGDQLIPGWSFCDGRGTQAKGEGPASQLPIHADIFGPTYRDECTDSDATFDLLVNPEPEELAGKLCRRELHFLATDFPLTTVEKLMIEEDLCDKGIFKADLHHIPLFIDAVAIGYKLGPECLPATETLKLSSSTLSRIFSGEIKRWDDPQIAADNGGSLSLLQCGHNISLVKREGFAGTTFNFKDYLSKRNPQWHYYKQPERNTQWPRDANFACESANEQGSAECIIGTEDSIGYVQYGQALKAQVKLAAVENLRNQFEVPSPATCQQAANTVISTGTLERYDIFNLFPFGTGGDWSTASLTDPREGYPICNFGFVLLLSPWLAAYEHPSPNPLRTIVDYLNTSVGLSRDSAYHHILIDAGYTPLPPSLAALSDSGIDSIRYY